MTSGESGRNQLAGETLTRGQNVQQAVDVGVLAGVRTGIVGVLGENGQTFFCGGGVDAAVLGGQGGVHGQGAGLARLVFDGGGHVARRIDQFEGGQVTDGGKLFEVVGKGHGVLQQGGGPVGRAKRALLCRSRLDLFRQPARRQGRIVTGQSADTDTVVASVKAYVNALNKLVVRRQKSAPDSDMKSVNYKDRA